MFEEGQKAFLCFVLVNHCGVDGHRDVPANVAGDLVLEVLVVNCVRSLIIVREWMEKKFRAM